MVDGWGPQSPRSIGSTRSAAVEQPWSLVRHDPHDGFRLVKGESSNSNVGSNREMSDAHPILLILVTNVNRAKALL